MVTYPSPTNGSTPLPVEHAAIPEPSSAIPPTAAAPTTGVSRALFPKASSAPSPVPPIVASQPVAQSSNSTSQSHSDEVASLRAVWQETRDKLDKARADMRELKRSYDDKKRDLEKAFEQKLNELKDKHQKEIAEFKNLLTQNQQELTVALKLKDEVLASQETQISSLYKQLQSYSGESDTVRTQLTEKESECDKLRQQMAELQDTHVENIRKLRQEFLERESRLEQERSMHTSTLHTIQSRESSLEAHNVEYMNKLAESQRAIEEKDRKLQKLNGEVEWMRADKISLENQLAGLRSRLEVEQNQSAKALTDAKERATSLSQRIDAMTTENEELSKSVGLYQARLQELEAKYSTQVMTANPSAVRISELEAGLKTMADHVLQKQAQIEKLNAERSALRLQLDNEIGRVKSLETRMDQLKSQRRAAAAAEVDDGDEFDEGDFDSDRLEKGGVRTRRPMRVDRPRFDLPMSLQPSGDGPMSAVAAAVGALDRVGAYFGMALRRYPAIRVLFCIYFLCLHLWVAFVLYHFMMHATEGLNP